MRAMKRFLKSSIISLSLSACSLTYFYYSSFIAHRIESQLKSQGVKLESVSGNLSSGLVVSNLEVQNETQGAKIEKIEFEPCDYLKLLTEFKLSLCKLSISHAQITAVDGTPESIIAGLILMPFQSQLAGDAPVPKENPVPIQFKKFALKNFTVAESKLIGNSKSIEIRNLQFKDIDVDLVQRRTQWTSFSIRSSFFDLDSEKTQVADGKVAIDKPITAKLYYLPGIVLKKPVDLAATVEFEAGAIKKLQANAFENKVTMTYNGQDYELWVNSLEPAAYLDSIPFDQVSFYSKKVSPTDLFATYPQTALFKIGRGDFALKDGASEATFKTATDEIHLKLPPGFLAMILMGEMKPQLSDSRGQPTEEILKDLGVANPNLFTSHLANDGTRIPAQQNQ